jgi:hypothetical protein
MQLVVEDASAVKPALQTHMKGKVGEAVGIAVGEAVGATVAVQLVREPVLVEPVIEDAGSAVIEIPTFPGT